MVGVLGWNSVNVDEQVDNKAKVAAVGLRILVQQLSLHNKYCSSNVVLKSCNLLKLSGSGKSSFSAVDYNYSRYSIKSCCLCQKKLRADKDVYMYKGDQGFCSVECRNRQIYLDDIADLEASTKKLLSSPSHYCSSFGNINYNHGIFQQDDFRRNFSTSSRRNQRLVL